MNPYSSRWTTIHANERKAERELAQAEIAHADSQPTKICGKCGQNAYYRPGVGAYQCPECKAVLSYFGDWR